MALLSNTGIRAGASGVVASDPYNVKRSARFNNDDGAYLNWTPVAAGNQKTWTFSCWLKRSTFGGAKFGIFGTTTTGIIFDDSYGGDRIRYVHPNGNITKYSNVLYRDPSAWYHIVVVLDTTDGTQEDRLRFYVNNERVTDWHTNTLTDLTQNVDLAINSAAAHDIGRFNGGSYFDGYITDIHFIDGTAKAAGDFAKTDSNGQWVPKKYTGSYGTNGFHLAMDPANGGTTYSDGTNNDGDSTGKVNSFIIDADPVSTAFSYAPGPTNTTYGPQNLFNFATAGIYTSYTGYNSQAYTIDMHALGSFGTITSLKVKVADLGYDPWQISVLDSSKSIIGSAQTIDGADVNWRTIPVSGTPRYLKFDNIDNGANRRCFFAGIEINGLVLTDHSAIGYDSSGNENHWHGNNIFSHEAAVGNANFKTVTYEGTGSSNTINVGLEPGLVWIKNTGVTEKHVLSDTVRGAGKMLYSDNTGAGDDDTSRFAAFTSTGFTVAGTHASTNTDGNNFVAWCWKAGGAASSNSDGSVTSSVSANTDAGFSIVSYTGTGSATTVGHGLGKKPDLMIAKNRDATFDWSVWHKDLGGDTKVLYLNTTSAVDTRADQWPSAPTTSVANIGTNGGTNGNGNNHILYCWNEVEGYSKIGSYKGNGNAAGPLVQCGFTPAFILVKRVSNANDWTIYDTARDSIGSATNELYPNTTGAQWSSGPIDINANGFQIKNTHTHLNASGDDYIFVAFAGSPGGDLDLLADTPGAPYDNELNGGGNYATLNPLACSDGSPTNNGNLGMAASTGGHQVVAATIAVSSDKWWWEGTIKALSPDYICFGMWDTSKKLEATLPGYSNTNAWSIQQNTGKVYYNGHHNSTTISSYAAGDDIAIAYDNGSCYVYKNGVVENSGNPVVTGLTGAWAPIFHGVTSTWEWEDINFGQRPFKYTPRTGHKALNAYNLSDPTITKGNTGFDTKLFTGTGSSQSTTGLEFEPDLVWIKGRSVNHNHHLFDQIRGVTKVLYSNSTAAEGTEAQTLTAFTSDGFTVGTDNSVNQNTTTYASWNWDAGTANVSKAAGDLNSSSLNQAQTWSNGMKTSTAATATYSTSGRTTTMGSGSNTDPFDADQTNFLYGKTGIAGTWLYLEFGTALSNVTSISFSTEYSCPSSIIKLNGTDVAVDQEADGGFREVTVTGTIPASLTEIAIQGNGGSSRLKWIKIDGKLLIDNGVTYNLPSIASTYRVNTNTGFSIVTCPTIDQTAETIAHGLNAVPALIIQKARTGALAWSVYHQANGPDKNLNLNTTDAVASVTDYWGSSDPTSQVFGVAAGNNGNNQDEPVYYCWSEVAGYSKFGTFEGNASTNGPFVWCGFRPKWIMLKNIDTDSRRWVILDNVRDPSNGPNNGALWANQDDTESVNSENNIDYLSNGFKLKCTNGNANESGDTFIFAAFAESPFKYSNAS